MSSSNLIRWSGLAALVGSVLLVVLDVVEFVLVGDQPDSVAAATSAWVILQVSFIVAIVLISLGLVGLYARQAEQAGTLGLIAFLVAFIGTVMTSGAQWSTAFIAPALASVISVSTLFSCTIYPLTVFTSCGITSCRCLSCTSISAKACSLLLRNLTSRL